MSEEPPVFDQSNQNEVPDIALRPGEEGFVQDPVKAEVMAYAEKPFRDDALSLDELKQHALSVLGDMDQELMDNAGKSNFEERTKHHVAMQDQRKHISRMEMSKDHLNEMSMRAADKAESEFDAQQEAVGDDSSELDKKRLNELTRQALTPGTLFGKNIELTDHDKEQFKLIVSMAQTKLEPLYNDPDWQAFMKLVDEGDSKGVLLSMTSHEGSNIPTWCIDGGDDPAVKKVLRTTEHGTAAGIQVPSRVYNLYHWHNTVKALKDYTTRTEATLKGTSAKPLGQALQQLASFVKQSEQVQTK